MTNTQEPKTVNYREYRRELSELQRKYERRGNNGSHIEIFELGDALENSSIQLGINWSAIGTVSPEEAEEFAHTLLEAAEDCRNFKYNGYVIDWSSPAERTTNF